MESLDLQGNRMKGPQERRKFPRLRREERAVLHRLEVGEDDPEHAVLYCKTVDISSGGLQVRAKQELLVNESVEAVITVEGYGDSFHLRGDIRWCRAASDGDGFLAGIELIPGQSGDVTSWRRIFN